MFRTISLDEFIEAGTRRYGECRLNWKFICPSCGIITLGSDWMMDPASRFGAGFSCIGNWRTNPKRAFTHGTYGHGPCDYVGGGSLSFNPIKVVLPDGSIMAMMDFADDPLAATAFDA